MSNTRTCIPGRVCGGGAFFDEIDRLRAKNAALAKDAAAGRVLWRHLLSTNAAWGEDQDSFVEMGLLVAVDMTEEDSPPECANCGGECDVCYRPTELLSGNAVEVKL